MAYVPTAVAPREFAYREISTPRPSLLQRFFDAMIAARQRQADREIAFYLDSVGGRFTDDVEREIESRFLSAPRW